MIRKIIEIELQHTFSFDYTIMDTESQGGMAMIRKIIEIDEEKCNGCGLCAKACHEGAIAIVNGKAKLMRDDFCDGFGDCLPACPMDAIHFPSVKRRLMTKRRYRQTSRRSPLAAVSPVRVLHCRALRQKKMTAMFVYRAV